MREYYEAPKATGEDWLLRSEIPGSAEIMDREVSSNGSSSFVEIPANKPRGPFASKEEYLHTHYELLREDSLRPLREAVTAVREAPTADEEAHNGQIEIYEKASRPTAACYNANPFQVHVCGITMSTKGIAARITFSLRRTGKQIAWEQSKRLITGSLVVLTPAEDMFQEKAIVAVVAARPLAGLEQNPPEIDLFIHSYELEIDPSSEYVMIEDRGGLYEANRHTLSALQHMMGEPFPLSEHLVAVQPNVSAPEDIVQSPIKDLTSVIVNTDHDTFENFNVLKQPWPKQLQSALDESQLSALCQILTKRLAIIQGPPGTGKTHVSVEAIRVMLANRTEKDPPIVIACQTNHAIDQMMRHILKFVEDAIRLGGQSRDPIVKKRTLYEVSRATSESPPPGCLFGAAKKKMVALQNELQLLLTPLKPGKQPLDHRTLEGFKLISKAQADSLEAGAMSWVQEKLTTKDDPRLPFLVWLGDKLIKVPDKQLPESFGFDYEETDLEFEQLKEAEAENAVKDDDDIETLKGHYLPLADNFTCRKTPGEESKAKEALKKQDMWKIPEPSRGAVYRYLQRELKRHIVLQVRSKAKEYDAEARKRQIGTWEKQEPLLKRQKVIGMTTTGLSKYRGLIAALGVKTILIEEAAETLEAPVTVACIPTLQQLILVGDHLQLRPHCHVRAHEDEPWNLNISLFERLVKNDIEYKTLVKQRRMIPEIRRLLCPIYKNIIQDHPSVTNPDDRPDVSGMGGVNSFFFTHSWAEEHDHLMSTVNDTEARMIVGFVEYLVHNDMDTEAITIITFYNGQRKRILTKLRDSITLTRRRFNVVTVDSYQGEENTVVILSLARSNDNKKMGFLDVENRICVALSRAQCGFYIFGNGKMLYDIEYGYKSTKINGIKHKAKKKTWSQVMEIMSSKRGNADEVPNLRPSRLDNELPLCCKNHKNVTMVSEPEHFDELFGGCKWQCGGSLPCGHPCPQLCHPFPHDQVNCDVCPKTAELTNAINDGGRDVLHSQDTSPSRSSSSNAESWKTYSTHESARVDKARKQGMASYIPLSERSSPERAARSTGASVSRVVHNMGSLSIGSDGMMGASSSNTSNTPRVKYTDRHTKSVNMSQAEQHMQVPSVKTTRQGEASKETAEVATKENVVEEKLIDFDD